MQFGLDGAICLPVLRVCNVLGQTVFFFLFRKRRRFSELWHSFWTAPRGRLWCLYHRTVFHLHGRLPRYSLYMFLSNAWRSRVVLTISHFPGILGRGPSRRRLGWRSGRTLGGSTDSHLCCGSWPMWVLSTLADPYCWFKYVFAWTFRLCLLWLYVILRFFSPLGSFLSPPKIHVSARSKLVEPFFNK